MALNLQSLSITSAFNSIVSFFKSQSNNTRWKELSAGSEGTFLIRLLSNVMSTISYRIVAQSRENYLSTASLISSNVGIAVNLGYSAFRGTNLKRSVYLTPNGNYTLPKFSVIGTYSNDYTILTLADVDLKEGITTKIDTVVGNLREESFITGTSNTKIFTLFTTGISEDFVLLEDGTEVPTTNIIKNMTEDKFLVRTNPYSSVDIVYLNSFDNAKYKYGTGTEFTIRYVELADVPVTPYTASMFTYGTLEDVASISSYLPFESVESLKVTAPLDHETQNLIRSKKDYANRLQQIIPAVTEANWKAITPTYTTVTYLKNDSTLLTGTKVYEGTGAENKERLVNTEVGSFLDILKEENYFGTPLPDITPPRREVAKLNISLALNTKYKNISDITLDVENILQNDYNTSLAPTFNTFDFERKLEGLSYVRYARVSYAVGTRELSTNYQLGYFIENNGEFYKATKILGYTGDTEPDWQVPINPTDEVDTGYVTKDGTIYWRCYKLLPNMPRLSISPRENSRQYGIGDFITLQKFPGYMFKCVDLVRESGTQAPDTTYSELGDYIVDGSIVWVVKERVTEAETWASLTQYQLGDTANPSGPYSLECVSYTGSSGTSANIDFEGATYNVVGQTSNSFTVAGNKTPYFKAEDVITAYHGSGYTTFVVVESSFDGTYTIIPVTRNTEDDPIDMGVTYEYIVAPQRGTIDGSIQWSVVENPNNVGYAWNSYTTFEPVVSIIEE